MKQMTDQPEQRWQPTSKPVVKHHDPSTLISKPLKPLTRKQQAFVKHLVDNPKASATQAARAAYNVTTDNSASQVATDNLRKPQIMLELSKYSDNAELAIVEVLEHSKKMMYEQGGRAVDWATNARQTADSLLDRLHGKATQRSEIRSEAVTLNIDLTGMTDQNPSA